MYLSFWMIFPVSVLEYDKHIKHCVVNFIFLCFFKVLNSLNHVKDESLFSFKAILLTGLEHHHFKGIRNVGWFKERTCIDEFSKPLWSTPHELKGFDCSLSFVWIFQTSLSRLFLFFPKVYHHDFLNCIIFFTILVYLSYI